MSKTVRRLFLSFRGRIARGTFWWASIVLLAVFVVPFVFIETVAGRPATLALYPPFFWAAAALAVKRLHDRGQSAWWLLLLAIPLIGPLWIGITLFLRAGTPGENQYGDDPRTYDADYLTVK